MPATLIDLHDQVAHTLEEAEALTDHLIASLKTLDQTHSKGVDDDSLFALSLIARTVKDMQRRAWAQLDALLEGAIERLEGPAAAECGDD